MGIFADYEKKTGTVSSPTPQLQQVGSSSGGTGLFSQYEAAINKKPTSVTTTTKATVTPATNTVSVTKSLHDSIFDGLTRLKTRFDIGLTQAQGGVQNTIGIALNKLAEEAKKNESVYRERAKQNPQIYGDKFFKERQQQIKSFEVKSGEYKGFGSELLGQAQQKEQKFVKEKGQAKGFQWLAEQVAQNTPSFLTSLGIGAVTGIVTKNPALAMSLGFANSFAQTAGQQYEEAKQYGVSDKRAEDIGLLSGTAVATLETLPIFHIIERIPEAEAIKSSIVKEITKSFVKQGLVESATESIQQVIQNAIAKSYDKNRSLWAGVPESAIVSFTMGGASGVGVDALTLGTGQETPVNTTQNKETTQTEGGKNFTPLSKGILDPAVIEKANIAVKEAVETPKEARTPQQQQIVDTLLTKNITPSQAVQTVISNDLTETTLGKKIMAISALAQQQGKNISLTGSESGDNIRVEMADPTSISTQTPIQADAGVPTTDTTKTEPAVGTELRLEQKPVGEGKVRESQAYSRVKDRLDEAVREDVNYNRLNLEQDTKNAIDFIAKDNERALRVAFGLEAPPEGQTETAISIALADKAGQEGKYKLQSQLESSRSLRQTRRGQEIVSERGRFNDDSPYQYMREVLDRRLKNLGSSLKSEVMDKFEKVNSAKKRAMNKIDERVQELSSKLKARDKEKITMAQDFLSQWACK